MMCLVHTLKTVEECAEVKSRRWPAGLNQTLAKHLQMRQEAVCCTYNWNERKLAVTRYVTQYSLGCDALNY